MQVCKYTNVYIKSEIKRKKGAIHILACKICLITTLTKFECQNMRYTNKSEVIYKSVVAAFFYKIHPNH